MTTPGCYGQFSRGALICDACHVVEACAEQGGRDADDTAPIYETDGVEGAVPVEAFSLALTLYSGQTFRWGRDSEGWWKGIAYGVAFHLRQDEDTLRYVASHDRVRTYAGEFEVESFLRWYLRTDEAPRTRIPRSDRHLRKARDRMRGFRFVRQEPWECAISYILSVQAHMVLTKQRIHFLSRILGAPCSLRGERYHAFPAIERLALLDEGYYRHQRFGWRSKFLPTSVRSLQASISNLPESERTLDAWRTAIDELRVVPNSGVGLKVAKCIDLFSLDRLSAVPVDTWVRKFAADWYGIEGSDAKICNWAEERGGRLAGYLNEYLFAYYRELNAPALDDRVISFAASDAPSGFLPFECEDA